MSRGATVRRIVETGAIILTRRRSISYITNVDHLFIVSRQQPDLYRYLAREFSTESDVEVILDRRHGERRARREGAATQGERRRSDRRSQADLAGQLNTLGYAFVRLG
jgi:hypothetical protein